MLGVNVLAIRVFLDCAAIGEDSRVTVVNHSDLSGRSERRDQIKNELAKRFNEQAEFYRKGGPVEAHER
jgi:hypothetical protein